MNEEATTSFKDAKLLKLGKIRQSQVISPPPGMTELDYDRAFLQKALQIFPEFESSGYPCHLCQFSENEYINSNTFIDRSVEESGGEIMNFDNVPLQNSRLSDE